ncbi:carbohydrate ABC transporter substrate-binding protein (CUT1 family) [Glaciihabitans tibetensis]|uniref:Carbohydrate ABC transporter substrate-binding protein (CUT1 family) n=1 Tax=Glaciihabitans tibetensis TaxID=1266600 RepID=A0A2T0V5H7_9MICO|nr:ABC transporter substrate-binding protein [Glaciihabitans tibetensis]PRY65436.1 carbohydrate ABC transporter substrate-binding protein (CUT1 family) [Glaciihabitans tibetensis]
MSTTPRSFRRITTVATTFLAIGSVIAMTGCATSADPESAENVTITFSSYNYGTAGAAGDGTQALLDRFAELHPEITVVPEAVPVADVLTKTKTAVAADIAPDVVQLGYSKLAEALETLPIQSIEDAAGDEWADHVEGINPALVKTGTSDGTVKALPYTVSIPTVFYNADLFRAAGLDPDAPPTSIEEVSEAAAAITATGAYGAYFGIVDSGKSDYVTQSVINSSGGAIVDAEGEVTLDSPEAIAGLQAVQDLTTEGLQPAVSVDDAVAAFSSGTLGMLIMTTAVLGSINTAAEGNFELRTGAFPSFNDDDARPTHSGASLVILSDDEAKQHASWELVKFLTSKEGYTMITEQIGYLPLRADLATDPEYLAGYFEENQLLLPPLEQLETLAPYLSFPGPKANQATVLLQDNAVSPIVLRDADVKTTLTETADRIRELVG